MVSKVLLILLSPYPSDTYLPAEPLNEPLSVTIGPLRSSLTHSAIQYFTLQHDNGVARQGFLYALRELQITPQLAFSKSPNQYQACYQYSS